MPKISIGLILFAVLILLAMHIWQRRKEAGSMQPFVIASLLLAAQALLVTLRWDFGFSQLRFPQVLLAAAMPSIIWLAFCSATEGRPWRRRQNLIHAIPIAAMAIAVAFVPGAIDVILMASFLFYGSQFLKLALSGDASFANTNLEAVFDMRRAVWLLAFTLIGWALVDVAIYLDFRWVGGQHAALMIGIGNLVWLAVLAVSIVLGSGTVSEPDEEPEAGREKLAQPGDHQIAETIQRILTEADLVKDPGLTLSRLARRAGLPARAVSNAINRVHKLNVSQYINDIRIAEACRLLGGNDVSITQAIYACGFQTKSNFNREFLRVTGKTPRDWRSAKRATASGEQVESTCERKDAAV